MNKKKAQIMMMIVLIQIQRVDIKLTNFLRILSNYYGVMCWRSVMNKEKKKKNLDNDDDHDDTNL